MKSGAIRSDDLAFDFADVKVPNTAFKRVVRDLEFDLAELAIFTFLLARAHGKPLSLLPAVVTARFQHPFLICDAARAGAGGSTGAPHGYALPVTTAAWVRAFWPTTTRRAERVAGRVRGTVAQYRDPPNA